MEIEVAVPTEALIRAGEGSLSEAGWSRLHARLDRRLRVTVVRALTSSGEVATPERVEDLVQEVWCRLLAHQRRVLRRLEGASAPSVARYLHRTATSVVRDQLRLGRARKRRAEHHISVEWSRRAVVEHVDPTGEPERRLLARERLRDLAGVCRQLLGPRPGRDRLWVVRLGLLEGRQTREIVARLGGRWTAQRVDSMLCRMRRQLDRRGVRLARRPRGRAVA